MWYRGTQKHAEQAARRRRELGLPGPDSHPAGFASAEPPGYIIHAPLSVAARRCGWWAGDRRPALGLELPRASPLTTGAAGKGLELLCWLAEGKEAAAVLSLTFRSCRVPGVTAECPVGPCGSLTSRPPHTATAAAHPSPGCLHLVTPPSRPSPSLRTPRHARRAESLTPPTTAACLLASLPASLRSINNARLAPAQPTRPVYPEAAPPSVARHSEAACLVVADASFNRRRERFLLFLNAGRARKFHVTSGEDRTTLPPATAFFLFAARLLSFLPPLCGLRIHRREQARLERPLEADRGGRYW